MITEFLREVAAAPGRDVLHHQAVTQRAARVLRPAGALARLDAVAAWLAGWQRTDVPEVTKPCLVLAVGDHGVVSRGVSAYPAEVTAAVVDAIRAGAATSAVMAEQLEVALRVVDGGVGHPTGDIVDEDALTVERFEHLLDLGRRTVASVDSDLLLVGGTGVGGTTASSAVSAALCGGAVEDHVGPGSVLDEAGVAARRRAVTEAVRRVGDDTPLGLLRRLGGAEHAILVGAIGEARIRSIPVLLDGFATAVAAAALHFSVDGSVDHCLAAHLTPDPGHAILLARLGLAPLLDLGIRLGEGSGALVALPVVRLAAAAVVDVATVDEWGLA